MKNNKFVIAGVGFNDILTLISNNPTLKKSFVGFIDDKIKSKKNCKILGKWNYLKNIKGYKLFNAVCKNPLARDKARVRLQKYNVKFTNLISDRSSIGNCNLGNGIAIFDFVFLGDNVKIGDHSIIHNNVSVGHDSKIGKNCFIAPGVKILGKCTIEDNVYIGAGSVIINNIKIKKNSFIGTNVVIIKNIPPKSKIIKNYKTIRLENKYI